MGLLFQNTAVWGDGSLMATRFRRSVPMSTYLVCFIVCDFLQLNMTTNEGTLVSRRQLTQDFI